MRERVASDAVMVGIGTVLADDPRLDARGVRGARDVRRVVLDSSLRTPVDARVLPANRGEPKGRGVDPGCVIACGIDASTRREAALQARGAEVWRVAVGGDGRVALDHVARRLGACGVTRVLVEGGGDVHAAMLAANLVDRVVLYVAPMVVGGLAAKSWVGGPGVAALANAWRFAVDDVSRVGADLRVVLSPVRAVKSRSRTARRPRSRGSRRRG
jgi:diaminohydroxyphosphoribosylaminopyrimidine deaminase/5-amino-6-(5-phosphoribosylamino)uracil reductase